MSVNDMRNLGMVVGTTLGNQGRVRNALLNQRDGHLRGLFDRLREETLLQHDFRVEANLITLMRHGHVDNQSLLGLEVAVVVDGSGDVDRLLLGHGERDLRRLPARQAHQEGQQRVGIRPTKHMWKEFGTKRKQ